MHKQQFFARLAATSAFTALIAFVATVASGQKPKDWTPTVDPANFVSVVDNPYFPLTPGKTYRYQQRDGDESLVVEVTNQTKSIMGVQTIVVRETAAVAGQTIEISLNWYAQDRDGNVWYFGEATQDYENGVPTSTAGSWEAGVGGALPGIIMEAHPQHGDTYFQEYAQGVAEDMATVLSLDGIETTPYQTFSNVLRTKEWTPLEGNSLERKFYAQGIGLIAEEGPGSRLELVSVQ
jgi:hypothetical protein